MLDKLTQMSRTTRKSTRPRASDRSLVAIPHNHTACQFQDPIGIVTTKLKMELRWKNARPDAGPEDKKAKPSASYSRQGWKSRKLSLLPVKDEECS